MRSIQKYFKQISSRHPGIFILNLKKVKRNQGSIWQKIFCNSNLETAVKLKKFVYFDFESEMQNGTCFKSENSQATGLSRNSEKGAL